MPLRPRDVLPKQAMEWFDTPGVPLNAKVVRELGRTAEALLQQHQVLQVQGPPTLDEVNQLLA